MSRHGKDYRENILRFESQIAGEACNPAVGVLRSPATCSMEKRAMRRLIMLCLTAMTLAGCAGAYVAGDAGPHHENLTLARAAR